MTQLKIFQTTLGGGNTYLAIYNFVFVRKEVLA